MIGKEAASTAQIVASCDFERTDELGLTCRVLPLDAIA